MATFSEIIQECLTEMRMMGGVDVQTYAQPVLAVKLQKKFNTLFDMHFWNEVSDTITCPLLSTGYADYDLSGLIKRFVDIEHIWHDNSSRPLTMAPNNVNRALITRLCYRSAGSAATSGFFQVLPINTGGSVTIRYRTKPDKFNDDSVVPLDNDLLVYATVADYLTDEGTNGEGAQKFSTMATNRLTQLEKLMLEPPRSMYEPTMPNLFDWRDA